MKRNNFYPIPVVVLLVISFITKADDFLGIPSSERPWRILFRAAMIYDENMRLTAEPDIVIEEANEVEDWFDEEEKLLRREDNESPGLSLELAAAQQLFRRAAHKVLAREQFKMIHYELGDKYDRDEFDLRLLWSYRRQSFPHLQAFIGVNKVLIGGNSYRWSYKGGLKSRYWQAKWSWTDFNYSLSVNEYEQQMRTSLADSDAFIHQFFLSQSVGKRGLLISGKPTVFSLHLGYWERNSHGIDYESDTISFGCTLFQKLADRLYGKIGLIRKETNYDNIHSSLTSAGETREDEQFFTHLGFKWRLSRQTNLFLSWLRTHNDSNISQRFNYDRVFYKLGVEVQF